MPVQFKDAQQEADVNLIIDDLLENASEALMVNDIPNIYARILDSEVGTKMQSDRLGKITEVLLDMYPEMLHHMEEFPAGMFYESDLTELDIPDNVQKFGAGVFALSRIKTINYGGTRRQWNALVRNSEDKWDSMVSGKNGKVGKRVVVNCTDAQNIYDVHPDEGLDEAMTRQEVIFKRNVLNFLREDGFPTFADYLEHFHFNLVTSEQAGEPFVAATMPEKGVVLINPDVDVDAISMLLRHEAAHNVFQHLGHMFVKLKELGINTPSELAYWLTNKAGDYHISNKIYDREDKAIAKALKIKDKTKEVPFPGMVTELDFKENPEYWNMDFDQLWDVFVKDYDRKELERQVLQGPEGKPSDEFIEGWNALVDAFTQGKITKGQIEKWFQQNKSRARS